jgi:hypothetical protein
MANVLKLLELTMHIANIIKHLFILMSKANTACWYFIRMQATTCPLQMMHSCAYIYDEDIVAALETSMAAIAVTAAAYHMRGMQKTSR